jgi:molecular chaperone HtpG
MLEMQFDFDGLIQLLAHHLYSEKNVFIRELIQNSHDSIQRRKAVDKGFRGRIDIETHPADLQFTIRDNGIGMNQTDLKNYLSSIGKSGTQLEKTNVEGLIGQFGIGFLSAFVVANRVEVRTCRLGEQQGWLWQNTGNKDYQLEPCQVDTAGTTVTVYLKGEEERGVIYEDEVKNVIRHYADMLLVPIYVNGSMNSVNTMQMPWEKTARRNQEEMQLACQYYLERYLDESVLEAIPLNLSGDVQVSGVLYISRAHVFQAQNSSTVRVFLNRMFLCENKEILPKWAQFINGIINTSTLTPTAARDTFIRNEQSKRLQKAIDNSIIEHLEYLSQNKPKRFSQILRYHNLDIKSACYYHDDFFDKFAHLLEWRTNSGKPNQEINEFKPVWRTLPQVLAKLPKKEGQFQNLPYFSESNSANQYFQMADAASTLVVDASYPFESELLRKYVKLSSTRLRLVPVDREDDPNVFRHLQDETDAPIKHLAEVMSQIIRTGGQHRRVRIEARHFEPKDLSAVVRTTEQNTAQETADSLLNDPNTPEDLREMAVEMNRMVRGTSTRLVINADNLLIRRLAKQNFANEDVLNIMTGVYNGAVLYNQELLTPDNARIFHDHFQELLLSSLEYIENQNNLVKRTAMLEQREREKQLSQENPKPRHLIFFMMTPVDDSYNSLIDTMREVIEDRLSSQLVVASDRQLGERIIDNARAFMEKAHVFIAEVTETNPNVIFDLGAVHFDLRNRPIILLRHDEQADKIQSLPVVLQGTIYLNYDNPEGKTLADYLEEKLLRTHEIKTLLDNPDKERYLSPKQLKVLSRFSHLPDTFFQNLAECYPTQEAWKRANEKDIKSLLGEEADLASALLKRIQEKV